MSKNIEILINNYPVRIELAQERQQLKFGFLGPLGTYTDEGADLILGKNRTDFNQSLLKSNGEVVRLVNKGEIDLGVVAAVNAIEGTVMETLREIVHAKDLTILGETTVKIDHMLLGKAGVDIKQIKRIYSHPQAFGQSSELLNREYPDAELIPTGSTTAAVEQIQAMADATEVAAIANKRSAVIYGMDILAQSIGDNQYNATRFWLVGRGQTEPTGDDTTLFTFIPNEDRPGILRDCLDVLAMHGLNLTRLDSHPTGEIDRYIFIASHKGHYKETMTQRAHQLLQERYCSNLRVLGSYRKAVLPEGVRDPGVLNGQ